ncbi:M20/M25/M40 family metallo-hydrolase [Frankia sp. CNm7]|uniref:M20/M25/M40 family metallo-hydrolase n=1 Tax=Frankia nepalensis TaxID=1836974 RepID=A0A937USG0_9ACTN|nr:M20/M25/M40 family metallo-hydrolase [Frankia nepalensis]MBL7500386.1 M20/M25/M40 family metallo-hydrolase [Frankia nepalensis]MBL7508684.1 M20/M25/M40 family metallo-hydrolase [Frankia nepalensis]MBL7518480.1 M20/M25/M40 family metallo-hydrolase [Frankia nepalensis]MBL7628846.1 M20/M25/M40 family metallo-hydrolase [Frankia nepalensis]
MTEGGRVPWSGTGADPAAEVVALASELIAIDTTNLGDPDVPGTERAAAEYVAAKLAEAGYEPTFLESGGRGRGNVIARLPGADPSRGALLVHGHLDVVPADASEWTVHPFSGEVADGYVWGRGAVDMKGMVAMTLAVARRLRREGVVPPRDLVFAFLADEEAGGILGARWLVEHRPDLFEGVTEAISEVGGFSVALPGRRTGAGTSADPVRAYLVETAEKGSMWLRLTARGTAGHGAMLHDDNAIVKLAAAVARLDAHRFPLILTDPVREFLEGVADLTGVPFDENDPRAAVDRLGNLSRLIGAALRDTANVTLFNAGYRSNVVPSVAEATVDARFLPGREAAMARELVTVLGPDVEAVWDTLPGVSTSFDGALVDAMARAIAGEDPGARLLPYMLSAGTDAKSFARLGIRHFGFAPLRLPPDLDFTALFHGVDERVPVDALEFGARVLDRLLRDC